MLTLPLEVGKSYITGNNRKYTVVWINTPGVEDPGPVLGVRLLDYGSTSNWFKLDGSSHTHPWSEDHALVDDWPNDVPEPPEPTIPMWTPTEMPETEAPYDDPEPYEEPEPEPPFNPFS